MTDVAGLLERLRAASQTVAVAESLTGGLVLATLTEVAGASDVVRGGVVVYATDSKTTLAGVDAALLARVGPVHPEVARALANGIRQRLSATFGVGVTGVAGPSQQGGHRVGEVHLAVAGPGGTRDATLDLADEVGRAEIRRAACQAALALLAKASGEEAR